MLDRYEVYEIALTLMASGWTSADRRLFIETNKQEEPENILEARDVEAIFDVIAERENDDDR